MQEIRGERTRGARAEQRGRSKLSLRGEVDWICGCNGVQPTLASKGRNELGDRGGRQPLSVRRQKTRREVRRQISPVTGAGAKDCYRRKGLPKASALRTGVNESFVPSGRHSSAPFVL